MNREDLIKILAAHAQITKIHQPLSCGESEWEFERIVEFITNCADGNITPTAPEAREPIAEIAV